MAHQALYRRFRPGSFTDLRGQEPVVRALRNAIQQDKVSHAYLFSGPRGTGKTSTARILAKALNCINPPGDGEPCGTCESCISIANNTSYDLIELDAASNNKVDDVRDLISKVAMGSPGKAKVYVLDEVHMLTQGAENALLKTLEEPPEHVVFVLCTTEPHKVVPTIRSRTQHLEFNLIDGDVLGNHARWIVDQAGLEISQEALDHAVRRGAGSARDTLSALEQIIAAGEITDQLDAADAIIKALATQDCGPAFVAVHEALRSGREPRIIGEAVLERLRNAFLSAMNANLSNLTDSQQEIAQATANQITPARLTRALEVLGTALVDMRQAPDPRVDLEVALGRLTNRDIDTDPGAILERLERLELHGGSAAPAVSCDESTQSQSSNDKPPNTQNLNDSRGPDRARAALKQAQTNNKRSTTSTDNTAAAIIQSEEAQPKHTQATKQANAKGTEPQSSEDQNTETNTQNTITQLMEAFPGAELINLPSTQTHQIN